MNLAIESDLTSATKKAGMALFVVVIAHVLGYGLFGCHPNDPQHPDTFNAAEYCAGEARAAFYVGGQDVEVAMKVYEDCLKRYP